MRTETPGGQGWWRSSRYGFVVFFFLLLVFMWFGLRLVLFSAFRPAGMSGGEITLAFLDGLQRDVFVAVVTLLPTLFWMWLAGRGEPGRAARVFFWSVFLTAFYVETFLLFTEFFFYEEFHSRFNTVAVDYLIYPHEVFVNIWQSYPVGIVLIGVLLLSAGWLALAMKLFARMWETPFTNGARFLRLVAGIIVAAGLALTINFHGAHVSKDRTLNELANNGQISFVAAFWTRNLDYSAFYRTLPLAEAWQRARRMLAETNTQFVAEGESITRHVSGDPARPRLNVVIFLEESLGSEFWGCLGRTNTLTPEMDKLAGEDGLLFTHLYACGNRTVRGMEGVLSSFPPLPGDSIVKRDRSDNVETIARVLKRDGYNTIFLYGGRGVFDGMRSFAVRNGYDRFIEQKHFAHPTFTTAWGVCDEDLFLRALEEFRDLNQSGQPFCATVLSVSNHKPYTFPEGKIPEDPKAQRQEHAVKYSDYALGRFFAAAKKEAFWTNTIFAVVADHGARVYGSQSIPIHSYEIPLVIAGPAVVKSPQRIAQLGGSLDVGPTLLGLLGRPYESMFFGRDLLKLRPEDGRALLNHNRDIGMLSHDRLVVLGLQKTVEFYEGDPAKVDMTRLTSPQPPDLEIEKNATAIYQVADELYVNRRYRLDLGEEKMRVKP